MGHIRALAVVVAVVSVAFLAVPARAGSVWDPNEPPRMLDIRWVGAYEQTDGRMRVTVSFYGRVHDRWFNSTTRGPANLVVRFTHDRAIAEYIFVLFMRTPRGHLVALLCESASGCGERTRVRRVDRDTIRTRVKNLDFGPAPGWSFRARSLTHDLDTRIDQTRWGVVT